MESSVEAINQEVHDFINQCPQYLTQNIIFIGRNECDRSLISEVDYYIPNRDANTVIRSEYADEYNVKILSAVDTCGLVSG